MFKFRLQRVLDHRANLEKEAKQEYLEARSARFAGENEIAEIYKRRVRLGESQVDGLAGHIELQARFLKSEDDEKAAKIALGVLLDEEAAAESRWRLRKQELEVMLKLREKARDEWALEMARREQAALDEWSVMRRVA